MGEVIQFQSRKRTDGQDPFRYFSFFVEHTPYLMEFYDEDNVHKVSFGVPIYDQQVFKIQYVDGELSQELFDIVYPIFFISVTDTQSTTIDESKNKDTSKAMNAKNDASKNAPKDLSLYHLFQFDNEYFALYYEEKLGFHNSVHYILKVENKKLTLIQDDLKIKRIINFVEDTFDF